MSLAISWVWTIEKIPPTWWAKSAVWNVTSFVPQNFAFQSMVWTYFWRSCPTRRFGPAQVGHDFLQKSSIVHFQTRVGYISQGCIVLGRRPRDGSQKVLETGAHLSGQGQEMVEYGQFQCQAQWLAWLDAEAMALKKRGRTEFAFIKEYEVTIW